MYFCTALHCTLAGVRLLHHAAGGRHRRPALQEDRDHAGDGEYLRILQKQRGGVVCQVRVSWNFAETERWSCVSSESILEFAETEGCGVGLIEKPSHLVREAIFKKKAV